MASTGLRLCRSWKRSRATATTTTSKRVTRSAGPLRLPSRARARSIPSAQALALDAYRVLGCYGFARIDLMLSNDEGELTVLEADAIPGFTETSLLPQAAEAAGISFAAIVQRVLDLALARARS